MVDGNVTIFDGYLISLLPSFFLFLFLFFIFKKNNFLIFDFIIKIIKENEIYLKLVKNLCILKLFNFYTK